MFSLVTFIFLIIFLTCYALAIKALSGLYRAGRLLIKAFLLLLTPRLLVFGYLLTRFWTHTLDQEDFPLSIFLLPEALLLPPHIEWTPLLAFGFSIMLTMGSALAAWLVVRWASRKT